MTEKETFDHCMGQENETIWGKSLGIASLVFALVAFGCSGGGEKADTGRTETKIIAQETVGTQTDAPQTAVTPPPVAKAPEAKKTQPARPSNPSLGITPDEFRLRFNKNSELIKSRLRVKKFKIEAGAEQDTFRQIFNDNLYLTGKVNKADGSIAETTLFGVLNGSLSTTVDLNMCIGTIVTVFGPELSQGERVSVLNALGINNDKADIYNLNKKVTKSGITYWTKSSRKAGLQFGAREADGNGA